MFVTRFFQYIFAICTTYVLPSGNLTVEQFSKKPGQVDDGFGDYTTIHIFGIIILGESQFQSASRMDPNIKQSLFETIVDLGTFHIFFGPFQIMSHLDPFGGSLCQSRTWTEFSSSRGDVRNLKNLRSWTISLEKPVIAYWKPHLFTSGSTFFLVVTPCWVKDIQVVFPNFCWLTTLIFDN